MMTFLEITVSKKVSETTVSKKVITKEKKNVHSWKYYNQTYFCRQAVMQSWRSVTVIYDRQAGHDHKAATKQCPLNTCDLKLWVPP